MNKILEQNISDCGDVYTQDTESEYAFDTYMKALDLSRELYGDGQNFNVIKALIRLVKSDICDYNTNI